MKMSGPISLSLRNIGRTFIERWHLWRILPLAGLALSFAWCSFSDKCWSWWKRASTTGNVDVLCCTPDFWGKSSPWLILDSQLTAFGNAHIITYRTSISHNLDHQSQQSKIIKYPSICQLVHVAVVNAAQNSLNGTFPWLQNTSQLVI